MPKARKVRRLADAYKFPGFRTLQTVHGIFGDPHARLIRLVRRGKKRSAVPAERFTSAGTTAGNVEREICRVGVTAFTWSWKCDGSIAGTAVP
jgi:hypothetical protein